jgi:hypothetical protein
LRIGIFATRTAMPPRLRLAFQQAHTGERGIGEHDMRNQAIAGTAVAAGHVVPDNPEVIDRDVRELWAPGAFPNGPNARRGRLEPVVDLDEAARIQRNSGLVEADVRRVRDPAQRNQQMAAFDLPFSTPVRIVTATAPPERPWTLSGLASQRTWTPSPLRTRLISSVTSASSRPMNWRPGSMMVTRLPNRRQACAISTPV